MPQASGGDGQKIGFERHFAVDGGVRTIEEDKDEQCQADQRDIEKAAGKTQPVAVNALLHQPEPEKRHQKSGERHYQPNQILPGFLFIPETDQRNEQQDGGEQQANARYQLFPGGARFQKILVWRLPQRLPEAAGFAQ